MGALEDSGKRIREQRERLGLTQGELAGLLGVSRPSVVGYEGANAGKYSVETAIRIADVLGVRVGWLLTGQGRRAA